MYNIYIKNALGIKYVLLYIIKGLLHEYWWILFRAVNHIERACNDPILLLLRCQKHTYEQPAA
jgi:hypothetical protein